MGGLLSEDEMGRWVAWKRAADVIWSGVVADITRATGLSGADFSVLTRLVEEGEGRLRQQRLAEDLGWERSRLSRHLDRMAQRGLVERAGDRIERTIRVTPEGRRQAGVARRAHARAVRERLLDPVSTEPGAGFWDGVRRLSQTER